MGLIGVANKVVLDHDVDGLSATVVVGRNRMEFSHGDCAESSDNFPMFALSKFATAAAVLLAMHDRAVPTSSSVASILGETSAVGAPECVTVDHLLSHTAGLPMRGPDCATLADVAERSVPLLPPGRWYSYSDVGFQVLGRCLEVLTGASFAVGAADVLAGVGWPVVFKEDCRAPSGGLHCSVRDLAVFGHALTRSIATRQGPLAAMGVSLARADGGFEIGRGLYSRRHGRVLVFQHGGEGPDASSLLVVLPHHDAAIAIVAAGCEQYAAKLALADGIITALTGSPPMDPPSVAPAGLKPYLGTFACRERHAVFEADDARLTLRYRTDETVEHRAVVEFYERDRVREIAGPLAGFGADFGHEFLRDECGHIAYARIDGVVLPRVD